MQGKYDRNIDDLERARFEDSRNWGSRYNEIGSNPYGLNFQSSYGQIDPNWLMQQRMLQQPFQQMQNPIHPFYSGIPHYTSPSYVQNFPTQQQFVPHVQPGFSTYVHPVFNPQFPLQTGAILQQTESTWGEYPERKWEMLSQRAIGRTPSRAFQRPPRNYKRSDELIRDEICKRLALTPEIDATDVEVIVRDGEVTLRGNVDDRFEKRLVEDIVESTFGVRDLLNEVRVGIRQQEQELTGTHSKSKEK